METKKVKWAVDPMHSEISFKVKHMMISTVSGQFEKFDVNVISEAEEDFTNAEINVEIQIDSINTRNSDRDKHLKSDDFFNAGKYPKMTFKSHQFDGENVTGELTVRDITKTVTLDVDFNGIAVDPYGQTKAGFELTGEINRKAFGLKWDAVTEAGSVVVSDKVKMIADIQLVKQS
jgi:polyisoprenoid-binding protein YceI